MAIVFWNRADLIKNIKLLSPLGKARKRRSLEWSDFGAHQLPNLEVGEYSGTPPYGHLVNTTTSLLRPLFFGPAKRPYIFL